MPANILNRKIQEFRSSGAKEKFWSPRVTEDRGDNPGSKGYNPPLYLRIQWQYSGGSRSPYQLSPSVTPELLHSELLPRNQDYSLLNSLNLPKD
jgi:hypothetical protein